MSFSNFYYVQIIIPLITTGPRGATVARLTPDQKVACSNHVGVNFYFRFAHQLLDPESDYVKSIFLWRSQVLAQLNIAQVFFTARFLNAEKV